MTKKKEIYKAEILALHKKISENIRKGDTFKSEAKFFSNLGYPQLNGKAGYDVVRKKVKSCCSYSKNGRQVKIDEIFQDIEIGEIIRNGKFNETISKIILNYLKDSQSEIHLMKYLIFESGQINRNYHDYLKGVLESKKIEKDLGIDIYIFSKRIKTFIRLTYTKYKKRILRSLELIHKKCACFDYESVTVLSIEKSKKIIADKFIVSKIKEAEDSLCVVLGVSSKNELSSYLYVLFIELISEHISKEYFEPSNLPEFRYYYPAYEFSGVEEAYNDLRIKDEDIEKLKKEVSALNYKTESESFKNRKGKNINNYSKYIDDRDRSYQELVDDNVISPIIGDAEYLILDGFEELFEIDQEQKDRVESFREEYMKEPFKPNNEYMAQLDSLLDYLLK